jgi:hypothetical protein
MYLTIAFYLLPRFQLYSIISLPFQLNNCLCCTAIPYTVCQDPGGVTNASYSVTGLTIGSTVTYTCDLGYQYEAGYLTRTCQHYGTWDGVPPVCSGMLLLLYII